MTEHDTTTGGSPADERSTAPDPGAPTTPAAPVPPAPTAWSTPVPSRADDPATRRNWAAAGHWSAFPAALVGFAFLGPLVVWLVKRDTDRWVAQHAVESLNFQLTWLVGGFLGGIVGLLLSLVTQGIGLLVVVPLAIAAAVAWIVFTIRGALAASRAEEFRYPLTVRLIAV